MTDTQTIRTPRPQAALLCALLVLLAAMTGCKSPLDVSRLRQPFPAAAKEEPKKSLSDSLVPEPVSEFLVRAGLKKENKPLVLTNEGRAEYGDALKIYEAGDYAAAEKEFKRLAKTYKNSTVREDALFMRGESQFKQKRYSWAQDSYDELFRDFPSTRHVDVATRRLFTIAKTWLGEPDFATTGEIQQVNLENPRSTPSANNDDFPHRWALVPNVVDRSRPVFDTNGRALQALKSIWMNDPTGPLADDALMMEATYYLRKEKYLDADQKFRMLREEYPKSEHLQTAFVLGSHVKLMSYQGAGYDGKTLEEARQLKESTLRLFPDAPEASRIRDELAKITEARAQREWELVEFYRRKRNEKAMAIYCYELLKKYPDSSYAPQARETLVKLGLERPPSAARDPRNPIAPDPQPQEEPAGPKRIIPDIPRLLPKPEPESELEPESEPGPSESPADEPQPRSIFDRLKPKPSLPSPLLRPPASPDVPGAGRVEL